MPEPIKIVVTAQTSEAAAKLQQFAAQQGSGLATQLGKGAKEAENLGKNLAKSRMGLMELEHSARATTDILLMGGNMRMLLAQIPQIMQGLSMSGVSLMAMVPYIAAVGAALGAGALTWSIYMDGVENTTKSINELIAALDKVPGILDKIHTLNKAGIVSTPAANRFADYLNRRKKLYIGPDGKTTKEEYHQVAETVYQQSLTPGQPGSMVPTGKIRNEPNPIQTNQAAINEWVQKQLLSVSENQAEAVEKLTELEKKAQADVLTGLEKEKAEIHDRYQKERDEIALTLQQAGNLIGPKKYAAAQAQIEQLKQAEQNAILEAEAKAQKKAVAQQESSMTKIRADEAKRASEALQAVEDKITLMEKREGVKRGQYAAVEYTMRLTAAQQLYYSGDIGEKEYTHLVQQAQAKRLDGEKACNAELKQEIQLKQDLARTEAELKLHTIQTNPFLSNQEKASASIAPIQDLIRANMEAIRSYKQIASSTGDDSARIQALTKVNDLTQQQVNLQTDLAAAKGEHSYTYQWGLAVKQLKDMNNLAKETAQTFQNVFNGAIQSISDGITGLIMGTMTWRQALMEIPRQILTEIVGAIVQMGVRWIATQIMMATMGKAIQAAALAASAPIAAAQAAIWAAPATLSTIATMGASAAAAPGLISFAEILTLGSAVKGFAKGGLVVGPGSGSSDSIPAMLSNGEYVFSAPAVQRIGPETLDAMHQGSAVVAAPAAGGSQTNLHFWDKRPHPREYLASSAGQHQVIELVRQHRLKIGIQT